jgi:aspartate kinase
MIADQSDSGLVPIVVQKYGGTSVGTTDRICTIAERVVRCLEESPRVVVVLSAMGKTTDQLVALAHAVTNDPAGREMDLLLATGEQVSVSLLGLALQGRGIPAVSLTASQCGIRTDSAFNIARIESIDTRRIMKELEAGRVVIVTGFQGISRDHEITTLGRGGSDITGAALAVALGAQVCEIYTDVDGVFSADPSVVPSAHMWPEISYEEAIEMASNGAKVLHPRAAEVCMAYQVPIHVRSSFKATGGTWIRKGEEMVMEQAAVVGVSSEKEIAKVTLLDVPDRPGLAARVFGDLSAENLSARLIIQSASSDGRGRITFVLDNADTEPAARLTERWKYEEICGDAVVEHDVAKISIVGSRLVSTPGLAARMFSVLAREGINIDCISSSEMKVACVIGGEHLDHAVRAVHNEFFPPLEKTAEVKKQSEN